VLHRRDQRRPGVLRAEGSKRCHPEQDGNHARRTMRLTRRAMAVLLLCLSWPAGAQFANGFEGAPPPPVDPCGGAPNIRPAAFVRAQVPWSKMFYGQQFPRTPSFLTPVGSWTLRSSSNSGPPIRGKYLTVPFTPSAGQNYRLSWLNTQAIWAAGYFSPR